MFRAASCTGLFHHATPLCLAVCLFEPKVEPDMDEPQDLLTLTVQDALDQKAMLQDIGLDPSLVSCSLVSPETVSAISEFTEPFTEPRTAAPTAGMAHAHASCKITPEVSKQFYLHTKLLQY